MPDNERNFDRDHTSTEEMIVPLSEHTWRLPQVDEEGKRTDDADGYKITSEFSDDQGELWVTLSRKEADGTVDRTEALPLETLERYQYAGSPTETQPNVSSASEVITDPHRLRVIDMLRRVPGFRERQLEGEAYEKALDESRREKLLGAQGIIRASAETHPQSMDKLNRQGRHRIGRASTDQ